MSFFDLVEQADRSIMSLLGGEVVTYAPAPATLPLPLPWPLGATSVPVTGIFDSVYVLVKGDALSGVEATQPAVFFRLEDLPELPEDDEPTLTIRGVDYRVTQRMPDDAGGIVLVLRRKT